MAENYRILAVCGAGLATSTHVAKTLQTGLEKKGITCQIRTCSVAESSGVIFQYQPQVILATVAVKRNMFRALIIGLIMVALVFFMATSLTPLITPAVIDAGLAEAGGNYSLFNTGEHVGFLILQVLKAIF